MSFQTVTVHLDAGRRCAARTDLAARIAAAHGGRLVGVVGTGVPDVVLTLDAAVPDSLDLVALSSAYLRARAEEVARDFAARASTAPKASLEPCIVEAEAVDAVCARGRCGDLVVVGQTDPDESVDGIAADLPQQVLLHAGAPLLIVPYAGRFAAVGRRVLVAWKDTRESARAVRDALPFLARAEQVTVLTVAEPDDAGSEGTSSLEPLRLWLRSHGIEAEMRWGPAAADAADALLSRATDLSADLIVMGGYGHSRLREWVLGGVTRHLLAHMTVPVLMSH